MNKTDIDIDKYFRENESNICQICVWQNGKEIYSDEWNAGGTLKLTRVQLGLFRIREQNSMDGGLLVPVWYISSDRFVPDPNAPGYRADRTFEPQEPLLILNAVDGSVIDPWKGY